MSEPSAAAAAAPGSTHAPQQSVGMQVFGYFVGLVLAIALTAISFALIGNPLIWIQGLQL